MLKNEITEICSFVRSKLDLLSSARMDCDIGFELLREFPKGCCKITCFIMMYYLSTLKQVPKSDLMLLANAQISEDESHAWFMYKNLHIDMTGDQFKRFNKPKIVVSEKNPWDNISYSIFPFEKEIFCESYEKKLVAVCRYLES